MENLRCDWAQKHLLEQIYHDQEWGIEEHEDQKLFEMLILESMQAGLSWLTILKKRETLTRAYDQFDYKKIAVYTPEKIDRLFVDVGVIRNKQKICSVVSNAQAFMAIQKKFGSFNQFIWSFAKEGPIKNQWQTSTDIPASNELSDQISYELKKYGFKFLGTTTVYAFLQAIGIIDDHLVYCYKRREQEEASF